MNGVCVYILLKWNWIQAAANSISLDYMGGVDYCRATRNRRGAVGFVLHNIINYKVRLYTHGLCFEKKMSLVRPVTLLSQSKQVGFFDVSIRTAFCWPGDRNRCCAAPIFMRRREYRRLFDCYILSPLQPLAFFFSGMWRVDMGILSGANQMRSCENYKRAKK